MSDEIILATPDNADSAIRRAFREDRAAVLATLVRQVGDLQLAEDAVQDAFMAAVVGWRRDGIPNRPGAWIAVASRNSAIDRLRRASAIADRTDRLAELMRIEAQVHQEVRGSATIFDDRLRLIFTCCHPALSLPARVALTLRTVAGLTTAEIARAFLVAEATMGKRIVRAKRKITDAKIPYQVPDRAELPLRVSGVLQVIYLVFNEGYSATAPDGRPRTELSGEAIRLARLIAELMPAEPEVLGLLALMLLLDARRLARVDAAGDYVGLEHQDRTLWNAGKIEEGLAHLEHALTSRSIGPYQVEAAIAALHTRSDGDDTAHWSAVASLYEGLRALAPSPVVEINLAAAVGRAYGAHEGLRLLGPLLNTPSLEGYQPLHATEAELRRQVGDIDSAARAYQKAIELSVNPVERAELERRLRRLLERIT